MNVVNNTHAHIIYSTKPVTHVYTVCIEKFTLNLHTYCCPDTPILLYMDASLKHPP